MLLEAKTAAASEKAPGTGQAAGAAVRLARVAVARLEGAYQSLVEQRGRLEGLAQRQKAATEALARLSAAEAAEMAAWASATPGTAPPGKSPEREVVEREFAEAAGQAIAAAGVVDEIEVKQRALAAEISAAKEALQQAVLDEIKSEGLRLHQSAAERAGELAEAIAGLLGLRQALGDLAGERGRAKPGSGQPFLLAASALANYPPEAHPSGQAVSAAAALWRAMIEAKLQ